MKHDPVVNLLKTLMTGSSRYIRKDEKFYVIAATLDKRGRVISIGENSPVKTHPRMRGYAIKAKEAHRMFLHAEVAALVSSPRKVYSIVVIRVSPTGEMALARPCPVCMVAIKEAKVKHIWYSTQQGQIEYIRGLHD